MPLPVDHPTGGFGLSTPCHSAIISVLFASSTSSLRQIHKDKRTKLQTKQTNKQTNKNSGFAVYYLSYNLVNGFSQQEHFTKESTKYLVHTICILKKGRSLQITSCVQINHFGSFVVQYIRRSYAFNIIWVFFHYLIGKMAANGF